ncbi:hypothetical protein GCM10029978_106990 [Actinoallomurus acanthiterrae]
MAVTWPDRFVYAPALRSAETSNSYFADPLGTSAVSGSQIEPCWITFPPLERVTVPFAFPSQP